MFSTGRYSRVKHSTGRDSKVEKSTGFSFRKKRQKKGIEILKLSTGEDADIRHATGTDFDKLLPIMKHSTGEAADIKHSTGKGFECPICDMTGKVNGKKCWACQGTGRIRLRPTRKQLYFKRSK